MMIETGIVFLAVFSVWLIVACADKWGSRETYTVETHYTAQVKQAAIERRHAETKRANKETIDA